MLDAHRVAPLARVLGAGDVAGGEHGGGAGGEPRAGRRAVVDLQPGRLGQRGCAGSTPIADGDEVESIAGPSLVRPPDGALALEAPREPVPPEANVTPWVAVEVAVDRAPPRGRARAPRAPR